MKETGDKTWNEFCGTAGLAMKEVEGRIVFENYMELVG